MNESNFLKSTNVENFINWLGENLPVLDVHLRVKKSRFVPSEIDLPVKGIEAVLGCYQWKSVGCITGDWSETISRLEQLANQLRDAVNQNNDPSALQVCKHILTWGGNRNFVTGAFPFLQGLASASPPGLCDYIRTVGVAFELKSADTSAIAPPVQQMNSMLTKVHALYALDGLPIYDSRVAVAIASLVEMWRIQTGQQKTGLDPLLTFPATISTRTVLKLYPEARHPAVIVYGHPTQAAIWSSAKIRLGWLLRGVLERFRSLFLLQASRMHAFEASLFMLGYDVTCLDSGAGSQMSKGAYGKSARRLMKAQVNTAAGAIATTVTPLSGKPDAKEIHYSGNVESGFNVCWGSLSFPLAAEQIEDIRTEFGGQKGVPLGANRDGSSADSFGTWLCDNGWPSAQYASAIAPILHHEGVIGGYSGKRPILLDF